MGAITAEPAQGPPGETLRVFSALRARPIAIRTTLLVMLGVVLLLPVWTVTYPPLVDYPNHLASAFILAHLKDPQFHFSRFYASDWNTYPYLVMDLILVGLQAFLPIDIAGKILLSLCLLSVPPAVWFFLRYASPGQENLGLWSFLICNNVYFFGNGFINLQLSLALCFVALGMWLRYLSEPSSARWWMLLGVATALYFTHLVGFALAGFIATSYLIFTRRKLLDFVRTWFHFLPGAFFYLHAFTRTVGGPYVEFTTLKAKFVSLLGMMLGYSAALDFLTLVVLVGCMFACGWDNPEFKWNHPWPATLAGLFILYLVFPCTFVDTEQAHRHLLLFLFVVMLALAKVGRRQKHLAPVAVLLCLLRTGAVESHFVSVQPHLAEMKSSFALIPEGSRVLTLRPYSQASLGIPDYFWAYGVIQRGWFSPYLFHDKGVQPFRVKLQVYDPPLVRDYFKGEAIDWSSVQRDYDYVWAYRQPQFAAELGRIGAPVFDSEGLAIYRLRNSLQSHSNAQARPVLK